MTQSRHLSKHSRKKFKLTAIASAVMLSFSPLVASANENKKEWGTNVELFAAPGQHRTLGGARVLYPIVTDNGALTYFDGRANISDRETRELNLGIGHRRFNESGDRIWGAYGFFDTKKTRHDNRFNQLSVGIENLGESTDFRFNYYLPIGDDEDDVGLNSNTGQFSGGGIFLSPLVEESMEGVDFEVGVHFPVFQWETWGYLKAYHYDADVAPSTTGGAVRIKTRPQQNIALELSYRDDDTFDSEVRFEVAYSFGYSAKKGKRTLRERMIEFAERDIDVLTTGELDAEDITDEGNFVDITPQIAPGGIVHVDNAYIGATKNGAFDTPYTDLGEAASNCTECLVYVHEGSATYTDSITLEANESIRGQGSEWFGIGGDAFPVINGHIELIDDNHVVAGIDINGTASADVIFGDVFGNVTVQDNLISAINGKDAISFNLIDSADVLIKGNTIDAVGSGADGVLLFANAVTATDSLAFDIDIVDNSISAGGNGIKATFGTLSVQNDIDISLNISGNDNISAGGHGIFASAAGLIANNGDINVDFNIVDNGSINAIESGIFAGFYALDAHNNIDVTLNISGHEKIDSLDGLGIFASAEAKIP